MRVIQIDIREFSDVAAKLAIIIFEVKKCHAAIRNIRSEAEYL